MAHSTETPLERLSRCHDRIETHLVTLEGLVEHMSAHGCDGEARAAAKAILGFFDTTGVVHQQDEDDDLFPLLRKRAAAAGRVDVAAGIEELEREHDTMERQWQRMREALGRIADGEGKLDRDEVARFAWLHRRHMGREGEVVLPFARSILKAVELEALAGRMAARREA